MPTDYFGPLPMPAPVVSPGSGAASGDPILDIFLSFFQAVLNDKLADAWAVLKAPGTVPVKWTFAGLNPQKRPFSDAKLPALFCYRDDETAPKDHFTQDWWTVTSTISLVWVYPGGSAEHQALRDPFSNAVSKVCRTAVLLGRDPAWVVPGDTYPTGVFADTQAYGSVLAHWTQTVMPIVSAKVMHLEVKILDEDGKPSVNGTYVATQMVFEIVEKYTQDLSKYALVDGVDVTLTTSKNDPAPLTIGTFTVKFQELSLLPITGPVAGGTQITILGTGFLAGASVTVGGNACFSVQVLDINTLVATVPPHVAGAVDVTVTNLSGETGTLVAAFTYV